MIELRSTTCIVRSYRPGDAASLAHHGNNRRYVREGSMRRSAIKDGRILDQHLYARVR